MKRIAYLILSLFILSDCFAHNPSFHYTTHKGTSTIPLKTIPVYVDRDFGNEDDEAISKAINEWNYSLNGMIVLKIVNTEFDMEPTIIKQVMNGDGLLILKIDHNSPLVHDFYYNGVLQYVGAFVDRVGGHLLYVVRDRIAEDYLHGVLLHELSHSLGANHRGGFTLMNPIYSQSNPNCIDGQTANQVAAYWMLPLDQMNYCEPDIK